jgi:hypothetical protein
MNHPNSKLLVLFAAAWVVLSNNAGGQMMRQPYTPAPHSDMNARPLLVTEDQWINSSVDRWLSSQRRAWKSLDPRFRGWVSHLLWTIKNTGHMSVISDPQEPHFQVPPACSVAAFVAPADSVAASMSHFRELLPDINWNAWNDIEPKFRDIAQWEMSVEYASAQLSKARRKWWDLNSQGIQSCLDAEEPSQGSATTTSLPSTAGSRTPPPNRYEQIDRREKAELQAVERLIAPEPIKQEAQERISDTAAVDKYVADVTRKL